MPNGPGCAEFWRSFIVSRCDYPAPNRLHAQLEIAEFHSFCDCGCNSFEVRIPPGSDILPLTPPGKPATMFFETDFTSSTGDSLEILLFADNLGNLSFIEVDLNSNSVPVPDEVDVVGSAYHRYVSASLLPD